MSARPRVLVSRSAPPAGLDPLKAVCDLWIFPGDDPIPADEFQKQASGVTAIFCHPPDKIDKALLDAAGMYTCTAPVYIASRLGLYMYMVAD